MGLTLGDGDMTIPQEDFRISEEAALWLHRLRQDDSDESRAQFAAWIRKGAASLEEFLFAQAVWQELDHLDPSLRVDANATDDTSVVELRAPRSHCSNSTPGPVSTAGLGAVPAASPVGPRSKPLLHSRPFGWAAALAASLCVVVLGWLASSAFPSNVYATRPATKEPSS